MSQLWSAEVPISSIIINRSERQRRELRGVPELAESIRQHGLIQPIVITRQNVLVAGERRLQAHLDLELNSIRVIFSDQLDPAALQVLELEENIKRVDLDWRDKALAVARYHRLSGSSFLATAKALGMSEDNLRIYVDLAVELAAGNSSITEAPKLSVARGLLQRQVARKEAAQVESLNALLRQPEKKDANAKSLSGGTQSSGSPDQGKSEQLPATSAPGTGHVLALDFHSWAESYSGARFNLIHCDFPYGVGMHKSEQGSGDAHGTYRDTPDIYWNLVDTLCTHLDRFCQESAHLVFWFSMDYYEETRVRLSNAGFRVNPFPLIWHKSDGSGILPDPTRGPRRTYETALFASRGDRPIVRAVSNSIAAPLAKGNHMSEKPQEVLRHFLRMVTDEHSRVLDPTCGSGSTLRAAHALGASDFLGLEINYEFATRAEELLAAELRRKAAPTPDQGSE